METFPFVGRTWVWLEGQKTGTAAGGAADIVAGSAGARVYDDILYLAPLNRVTSGARKGELARETHGTRGAVITALRRLLETGEVSSNLAEGALRVAERRAAGDWRELSKPELPPSWGLVAPVALTDALADAIDDALAGGEGEGDITFDVGELELQSATMAGAVDVLETGELQPRLPGAEGVRETEQATPEFDAPFALNAEAAPVPGVQPSLVAAAADEEDPETFFQAALGTLRGFSAHVAPWLTEQERQTIVARRGKAGRRDPSATAASHATSPMRRWRASQTLLVQTGRPVAGGIVLAMRAGRPAVCGPARGAVPTEARQG